MDKKIRTLKECKQIAAEQQFKHVRLLDLSERVMCAWNPSQKGTKMTLEKKYDEIERRLKSFDPGVYIIQYRARFSGREPIYSYYLGNKNYNPAEIDNAPEKKINEPVAESGKQSKHEKLLSLETALDYATENARLTAENDALTRRVKELEAENAELNSIIDDEENGLTVGDGKGAIERIAESLTPVLLPTLDRFFDFQERKQKFAEMKYLNDKGYDLSTMQKNGDGKVNGSRRQKSTRDFTKNIPTPDDADWGEYLTWLGALSDDDFNSHLEKVEKASKDVHAKICEAFDVTFEDDKN